MSSKPPDDFDALRLIVDALKEFDAKDQERIIRWAREKIGLTAPQDPISVRAPEAPGNVRLPTVQLQSDSGRPKDIKTFIDTKSPQSDNQFAAAVAYYYRFEAPESERKLDIVADDLQEAARKASRSRLKHPAQTLVNAHGQGYFDKAERGRYALNTVGENLVAMALPQGAAKPARRATKANRRTAANKK